VGGSNIYKESVCTGLILFKYATSGTVKYHNYLSNTILSCFTILYINCLQERAWGGEGVVLNREITITNNLIYFLNLSPSLILLSQSWLVQTWNFITTLFANPICAIIILSL
jgi:hypothetical protein